MVTLHIWKPTTPETVLENGVVPDVGHASLEVADASEAESAYISFWPETDSLIGRVTQFWKPRETRHPATYSDECAAEAGYMQRPADYDVTLYGIDEAVMIRLWNELADSAYDFLHWNCSNVCKFLLLSAVPPESRAALVEAMGVCPDDTNCIDSADSTQEKLRFLATSAFIDCRPEDLKRAADACLAEVQ